MASTLKTLWFAVAVAFVCTLAAAEGEGLGEQEVANDDGSGDQKKGAAWLNTKVNAVTAACPYGETFYRACVRCVCEATLKDDARKQFPAHHLAVCAGSATPTDCPDFTCKTSARYLAVTPCEGRCSCNPATKITTCKRHPCPYE